MLDLYEIVRGPLVWIAFIVFLGGTIYNLCEVLRKGKEDPVFYKYIKIKYTLRSYLFWLVPFGSYSMRNRPWFTIISYVFHIGIILVPIFFIGHIELWNESWGISWRGLPNIWSDILTISTILCGILLLLRRIFIKDVRYFSTSIDYIILLLVILVFITGFLARYQLIFDYKTIVIIHMLLGEIILIIFPFTRFSHMFYFWFIRAHTGSEFGAVRKSKDF